MNAAYREVGSYRAAALLCGTTAKTVRRAVLAAEATTTGTDTTTPHNYDVVADIVADRVEKTKGLISAKRLLPTVRAAGYEGSARNLRRLVAEAKGLWRSNHHRGRRPGVWAPGDVVVIDWGQIGPLLVFCAVAAWSRFRFVIFADNQRSDTTLAALAACFEALGGVPRTVLSDRMGCLKGGTVAGVVVPTADYVRFATHYGFRPDFCQGADPESKGLVENLVGYVKSDLMVPRELSVDDLVAANAAGVTWCAEVNGRSTPRSAPSRPSASSPRPSCSVRCRRCGPGSASSSCARSTGSAAFASARPATRCPPATSGNRSRSASPTARSRSSCWERSSPPTSSSPLVRRLWTTPLRRAEARSPAGGAAPDGGREGVLRPRPGGRGLHQGGGRGRVHPLAGDLDELAGMEAAHGRVLLIAALERAVAFGRFRALTCAPSWPQAPAWPGPPLRARRSCWPCPWFRRVPCRTTPSGRARDHHRSAGVAGRPRRRVPPAATRRHAPAVTGAAGHGQDAALGAGGVPPHPHRRRDRLPGRVQRPGAPPVGGVPGDQDAGGVQRGHLVGEGGHLRLPGQPRVGAGQGEPVLGRPGGTGKSHLLVALGHHGVEAGLRVRFFTAAELVETLYRGMADNSVGRVIETILRADLVLIDEIGFAPLDHTGAQLFFRLVAAAYERRSLGIGSHWPFEDWGRFLPEHTTAVSLLDRLLHHAVVVVTEGESFRMKEARSKGGRPGPKKV